MREHELISLEKERCRFLEEKELKKADESEDRIAVLTLIPPFRLRDFQCIDSRTGDSDSIDDFRGGVCKLRKEGGS